MTGQFAYEQLAHGESLAWLFFYVLHAQREHVNYVNTREYDLLHVSGETLKPSQ